MRVEFGLKNIDSSSIHRQHISKLVDPCWMNRTKTQVARKRSDERERKRNNAVPGVRFGHAETRECTSRGGRGVHFFGKHSRQIIWRTSFRGLAEISAGKRERRAFRRQITAVRAFIAAFFLSMNSV